MSAKKKTLPAMNTAARQPMKRKFISISPMHSSSEVSGCYGESLEKAITSAAYSLTTSRTNIDMMLLETLKSHFMLL